MLAQGTITPFGLAHIFCVPDLFQLLHQPPPVIHNRVCSMARQLGIVPVDHRATARQVLGQKVTQPHPPKVPFAPP